MTENKKLIIKPTLSKSDLDTFLSSLRGITILNVDPKDLHGKAFKTIFESEDADIVICRTIHELKRIRSTGKRAAYFKVVSSNKDVEEIMEAIQSGVEFVVVDGLDWKIIPLENIIAKLHQTEGKIYTTAKNAEEVITMFGVLEFGVDGVILSTNSLDEVNKSMQYLELKIFPIKLAKIVYVKDVGSGERVCVDTTSILKTGEGMLVGSQSNFMFLIHNESVGSSFTSPRPFRVNAGAIHCYTITSDGNTKYLSEIEAGTEIMIVNKKGLSRRATVGRSKIETRPLRLIRAESEGKTGSVILQNAETIRLITKDGTVLPVTQAKVGDEILAYTKIPSGRHFGLEVNEFILEK